MSRMLLIEAAFVTKQLPHTMVSPTTLHGVCPWNGGSYSRLLPLFKAVERADGRVVMWSWAGVGRDDLMLAMGLYVRQDGFECFSPAILDQYGERLHNPEAFTCALADHDAKQGVRLTGKDLENYRTTLRRLYADRGVA